ncbi:MAG: hypothetical protein QW275_01305 [Candidatus Anstonellaceae archaeon]
MLPCSQVYWKILPSISRQLAIELEKQKVPRRRIAAVLGLSEAAVSQYISGKRGVGKLPSAAKKACRGLAKKITQGMLSESKIDAEIAKVVALAKKSRLRGNDPCLICCQMEAE